MNGVEGSDSVDGHVLEPEKPESKAEQTQEAGAGAQGSEPAQPIKQSDEGDCSKAAEVPLKQQDEQEPAVDDAPKADDVPRASAFDGSDRWILIGLGILVLVVAGGLTYQVNSSNLSDFPAVQFGPSSGDVRARDYFWYALELRERRLQLALTFRTGISILGYTLGLILASFGGLFIFRRATSEFNLSVNQAAPQEGDAKPVGADPITVRKLLGGALATNSPGIVFMLGAIAIVLITQQYSIPVGAPEIFPYSAQALCARGAAGETNGVCPDVQDAQPKIKTDKLGSGTPSQESDNTAIALRSVWDNCQKPVPSEAEFCLGFLDKLKAFNGGK